MSEQIKLTQAQALFAVLAGNSIPRHERVYYRDGALRSTLYSPIMVEDDFSLNTATIGIEITHITSVFLDVIDTAANTATIDIIKTVASKPDVTDYAENSVTLNITAYFTKIASVVDVANNHSTLLVTPYQGVYPEAKDNATNTATLTVVKL